MKSLNSILFLYLFTFFSCSSNGLQDLKEIDHIINKSVENDHPGLGIGIVKNGKVIYEKYRGLSNLQHQIPFSKKTRSNIASTAKQFTALMILDLSLKGKLNLDEDVRKYFPNLYNKVNEKIKVRHLINHTSGIHEYVDLIDQEGKVWWKQVGLDNDKIIKLLEKQTSLEFSPGTKYNYSNSNYNVLAKVIEKVSGEKFTSYSKKFFNDLNEGAGEPRVVGGYDPNYDEYILSAYNQQVIDFTPDIIPEIDTGTDDDFGSDTFDDLNEEVTSDGLTAEEEAAE